jgi:hypothetical protein
MKKGKIRLSVAVTPKIILRLSPTAIDKSRNVSPIPTVPTILFSNREGKAAGISTREAS